MYMLDESKCFVLVWRRDALNQLHCECLFRTHDDADCAIEFLRNDYPGDHISIDLVPQFDNIKEFFDYMRDIYNEKNI